MGKLNLLFSYIKDLKSGRYKSFSKTLFIVIVFGFLYMIMPIDFIPDWIPFVGIIDDAAVLGLMYKQLKKDLEKYRLWKERSFYL